MHAIISDIHGNVEALNAVLAHLDDLSVDGLICLGDLIGYGPDSIECLRIATQWPVVIAGDWDRAIIDHDPKQWMPTLNEHIEWIRDQLSLATDRDDLIATARQFNTVHEQFGCIFTHATLSDVREFVFPEEIYNPKKLDRIASEFDAAMFVGHTHIPGLFTRDDGNWTYVETADGHQCDITTHDKLICNVGSVGQPRDGDCRASFVLFDGRVIQFHRIEYDFRTTIADSSERPAVIDEHLIRSRFGGTIFPPATITVEPLKESGIWWSEVVADAEDDPDLLSGWRKLLRWFNESDELSNPSFVRIGDREQLWEAEGGNLPDGTDMTGGVLPRLAVGLTKNASLVGLFGYSVQT